MIKIDFYERNGFDHKTKKRIFLQHKELFFENSLLSISKWESITNKPFYTNGSGPLKTNDEIILYIWCMLYNDVDINYIYNLSNDEIQTIQKYIANKNTATTVQYNTKNKGKGPSPIKVVTSEVIYYAMFERNIPIECEKWNINRLKMLIEVFDVMNDNNNTKKNNNRRNIENESLKQAELNAQRQEKYNMGG